MRIKCTLLILPVCLILAGGIAFADSMLITYRSGKAQTFRLDEPSSKIVSITYQKDNAAAVEQTAPLSTKTGDIETDGKPAAPAQKSTITPQASGKPGVRIEWAPPVE
jgi:hypothetical protein